MFKHLPLQSCITGSRIKIATVTQKTRNSGCHRFVASQRSLFSTQQQISSHLNFVPQKTVNIFELVSFCAEISYKIALDLYPLCLSAGFQAFDKKNPRNDSQSRFLNSQNSSQFSDPVTIADLYAQHKMTSEIRQLWPQMTIVGEECTPLSSLPLPLQEAVTSSTYLTRNRSRLLGQNLLSSIHSAEYCQVPASQVSIFIDPLDGTKELVAGDLKCVVMMIGIVVNNRPVAGVLNQIFGNHSNEQIRDLFQNSLSTPTLSNRPFFGRILWGLEGAGVYETTENFLQENGTLNPRARSRTIQIEAPKFERDNSFDKKTIVTSLRNVEKPLLNALTHMSSEPIWRVGGSGYKSILLLKNEADGFVFQKKGTKKWDTCAPEALITSLGGVYTDLDGELLAYQTRAQPQNIETEEEEEVQNDHDIYYGNSNGLVVSLNPSYHSYLVDRLRHELADKRA